MNKNLKVKLEPPELQEIILTYTQENDDMAESSSDDLQYIKIIKTNAGGGSYFVIETQRWAFDTLENLIELFKKLK